MTKAELELEALTQLCNALDGFMAHAPCPRHITWKQVLAAREYLSNVRNGIIKEAKDENSI